jgi:hypothetical protein
MDLEKKHSLIQTKADLAEFIAALRTDLKSNPSSWENADLDSFLEAMQSWTEAMEGYYKNHGRSMPNPPTWQVFGDMLMGARIYE